MSTDWTTIAEPRADGSDTTQIKALVAATGFTWPTADSPKILNASIQAPDFEPFSQALTQALPVEPTSDFIVEVEALLSLWPEYTQQLQQLLTRVYPILMPGGVRPGIIGGTSGTVLRDVSQRFGMVYGTADNAHALAGAIVSGVANWKLYAIGVLPTAWSDVLFTNTVEELVPLPMRTSESQPFGTVLHAHYALLHYLDWNLRIAQTRPLGRPNRALFSVRKNMPRIQIGLETLQSAAKTTPAGAEFIASLTAWATRLLGAGAEWM